MQANTESDSAPEIIFPSPSSMQKAPAAPVAQAILGFPEIIILDEPTVGLDPKQIIEIRELIRELAKEHTVILSSHILAEIREVCDYIMIISKGKLVASDTPEHLEELMNGSDTIHIETRAEKETVREILSGLKDIEDVSFSSDEELLKQQMDKVNDEYFATIDDAVKNR